MNQSAVVFPGQGSQSLGMLSDIAQQFSEVKKVFSEASDALHYDLWQVTQDGPQEKLDQTMYTQPALLAASYAIWQILQKQFVHQPSFLAGHSLGEYTALVAAGAIEFQDAIKLVSARGQYMQTAVMPGVGAMAAIVGLDDAAVNTICTQAQLPNEVLSPANFNSIGQVVIAGHKASVEKAIEAAKASGAKLATLLAVSVPSHCDLMRPAADKLSQLLAQTNISDPQLPVIRNIDAAIYQHASDIRDGLTKQLFQSVQWVKSVQAMTEQGVEKIIECGPGKVLTGLNKRINKSLQLSSTQDLANLNVHVKHSGAGA